MKENNSESVGSLHRKLTELKRLSDLSQGLTVALPESVRNSIMLEIPNDITELEKAIVCIALYWYEQNVVEKLCYTTKGSEYRNAAETKVVWSLNIPNSEGKNVAGGEIGMFWDVCWKYGIGLSRGNKRQLDQYYDIANDIGATWNAYCAVFCGFVWLEALVNLGIQTINGKDLTLVIKGFQARVKNQITKKPTVSVNDGGMSLIDNFIELFGVSSVTRSPRVGAFFYRRSYVNSGNNHCGIVVKVDETNQKFWTVEGNAKRADGAEGIATWEYSFSDINDKDRPMYFISFAAIGKEIDINPRITTVEGVNYEYYYKYKPYFTHNCWVVPTPPPPEIDCPEGYLRNADGECIPPPPPGSDCPEGYERDADGKCVPLPPPPPPINDCPEGYARNDKGECEPNVPPPRNTPCCPDTIKVTTNPMRMLPISVFQKNEVSGLHADILADIIGADKLDLGTIRENSTHGMAMGLLNAGMDTGVSTGFGLFRGTKDHNGHYNTYMIGYGGNKNFISALCNGIGGAVDPDSFTIKEGDNAGQTLAPHQMAEFLIDREKRGKQNYEDKNGDLHAVANWLRYQPFMLRNGLFFRTGRIDKEERDLRYVWEHFCGDTLLTDNAEGPIGNDGHRYTFVPFSQFNKANSDEGNLDKEGTGFSLCAELKEAVNGQQNQITEKNGVPMMYRTEGYTWFISEDGDGNNDWTERGVAMTLPSLLHWLDSKKRSELTVIVLKAASRTKEPPLFSADFWAVFNIACAALQAIPGIGTIASMGGGVIAKFATAVEKVVPILQGAMKLGSDIENIARTGNFNFASAVAMAQSGLKMGMLLCPPEVQYSDMNGAAGPPLMTTSGGFSGFLKDIESKVRELGGNFEALWKDAIKGNEEIVNALTKGVIGDRLAAIFPFASAKWRTNEAQKFLQAKTGMTYNELISHINSLTNIDSMQAEVSLMSNNRKIIDLDDATKYWQIVKDFSLTESISNYFQAGKKAIWQWDFDQKVSLGSFMKVPVMQQIFMKMASPSSTAVIPGIGTVLGTAFQVNGGEGLNKMLSDYGQEALHGAVKAFIGMPVDPLEMKNSIIDAFIENAGIDLQKGNSQANPILLPSYIDPELRECIICKFEYEKVWVQHCDPGMTYNYLTGKCEKQTFTGFKGDDCESPCDDIIEFTGELPKEIIKCEGSYYFDAAKCTQGVIDKVKDVLNPSVASSAIGSAITTVGAGLINSLLDGSPTNENNPPVIAEIADCIPVNDCIARNPNWKNAIYTKNGWHIYTGDSDWNKFPAKRWLKVIDFMKCKFELVPCGCCDSLHISIDNSTQFLAKKLEELTKLVNKQDSGDNSVNLLKEIKNFRKQIENNKLYVSLDDGEYFDDRTEEINLLILELERIIEEMKYCQEDELTAEILALIDRVKSETHNTNFDTVKDKIISPDKANFSSENYYTATSDKFTLSDVTNNKTGAVLAADFYEKAIDDLNIAIEKARIALENCTCEDINLPAGDIHNHYYNENPAVDYPDYSEEFDKLYKKIEELERIPSEPNNDPIKPSEVPNSKPFAVPEYSEDFDKLYKKLQEIEDNLPDKISANLKRDLQIINQKLIEETVNRFGDLIENKFKNGEIKLECPNNDCKDRTDEILEKISQLKLVCNCNETEPKTGNNQTSGEPCDTSEIIRLIKNLEKKIDEKEIKSETIITEIERIIERTNSKFIEKFTNTVTEKITERFFSEFHEKITEKFEKVIEKTECKECDNSELFKEIKKIKELPLSRKFQLILGKIPAQSQWLLLLHGIPGSGKSTYSLVLAKELSKFGNILYANFEEAIGPTLQKKIEVARLRKERIKFLENNTVSEMWRLLDSEIYKYCVIDSISEVAKSEKKVSEFGMKLREYQNTSFILIGHATKAPNGKRESDYKGVSTLGHLIDINQRIIDGTAWNDKNRFLGKDCSKAHGYNFFSGTLTNYKQKSDSFMTKHKQNKE